MVVYLKAKFIESALEMWKFIECRWNLASGRQRMLESAVLSLLLHLRHSDSCLPHSEPTYSVARLAAPPGCAAQAYRKRDREARMGQLFAKVVKTHSNVSLDFAGLSVDSKHGSYFISQK